MAKPKALEAAEKQPLPPVLREDITDEEYRRATQLAGFVRQLPQRNLGPRQQAQGDKGHSTARAVLLCASGKGGVGKSTTAVNLAYALHELGLKVGVLDLDIYGPSLPELVKLPEDSILQNQQGFLKPATYGGVQVMSWGYVQPGQSATIRAPIVNQITAQLLTMVVWGDLDVLVIDSPPGTGDVHLSLAQSLQVDGAVLVTTANLLSLADVAKGIQLFEKVEIPVLLTVVNMSCIACEACGHEQDLFIDDVTEEIPGYLRKRNVGLFRMPLDPLLSKAPMHPEPELMLSYPFIRNEDNEGRPAWLGFRRLAAATLQAMLGDSGGAPTTVRAAAPATALRLRTGGLLEVRVQGGDLRPVPCGEIRAACRCAHCVDDVTGEVKIDREKVRADVNLKAKGVEPVGNYAWSVEWADGHRTLVSIKALEEMVGGAAVKPKKETAPW